MKTLSLGFLTTLISLALLTPPATLRLCAQDGEWPQLPECVNGECSEHNEGGQETRKIALKVQKCELKQADTAGYQKCRSGLTSELEKALGQRWAAHYIVSKWAAANYRFLHNVELASKYEKMAEIHAGANEAWANVQNSELCHNQERAGTFDRNECAFQSNLARLKMYEQAGPQYSQYAHFAKQDANLHKGNGFLRGFDSGAQVAGEVAGAVQDSNAQLAEQRAEQKRKAQAQQQQAQEEQQAEANHRVELARQERQQQAQQASSTQGKDYRYCVAVRTQWEPVPGQAGPAGWPAYNNLAADTTNNCPVRVSVHMSIKNRDGTWRGTVETFDPGGHTHDTVGSDFDVMGRSSAIVTGETRVDWVREGDVIGIK